MSAARGTLFETPLGPCGIAWNARGIVRIQLPERTPGETLARMSREHGAPLERATAPAFVRRAIASIRRHLEGELQEFGDLELDLASIAGFRRRVYESARAIRASETVSYAELAGRAGSPRAFRAVGRAMATNPWPIVVPCHRVLASNGKPGGFSAYGALETKARLLALEGVALERPLDDRATTRAALRHLRDADPLLARAIERVGPCRLRVDALQSPYEALGKAIIYQQLAGRAAAAIHARTCGAFGGRFPSPEEVLAARDETLRACGLSRPKLAALRDLAARTLDGTVPALSVLRGLADEAIVERLTAVRGVGRWTVEMLLVFRLGRPDVLPATDYGVRKGFQKTFRTLALPSPKAVLAHGERWRPYRSVASWYLWRVLDP